MALALRYSLTSRFTCLAPSFTDHTHSSSGAPGPSTEHSEEPEPAPEPEVLSDDTSSEVGSDDENPLGMGHAPLANGPMGRGSANSGCGTGDGG